ncbi:hypothetical protein LK09_03990 [Microbacterium mangrovi]|uniref:Uncharacterized protein n=1 Tax=Microbacterium mangrovi TaxID=1348253 RepID=A0A0B2A6L4_9MICO|nr:hypothetical protein [Microbacterium mangrovi]KHK99174.1 hypothetical protein LK09_03990 [Microbacterium mangrovi]
MPKQLINLIGIVVAAGILVLAVVIGVVPQISTALSTSSQADQVAAQNDAYQLRIDQLQRQKQNMAALNASVAQLHRQIPAEYRLDDVFLLVANSAQTAKATITSVTAGDPAAFVQRSAPVPAGQPTPAPTASATPAPSASASPAASPAPVAQPPAGAAAAAGQGRTQIEITIQVTVPDTKNAAKFLDALRSGPRLLANVSSVAAGGGTGSAVSLQVTALAFAEPSTAVVAKGGN